MLSIIHERIPLREWLAHMSLFHANIQIRNESTRILHITMVLEEGACANHAVSPHALEPGYSHLYSIPQQQNKRGGGGAAARVSLAFRDSDDDGGNNNNGTVRLLLRSGDRLRVASS